MFAEKGFRARTIVWMFAILSLALTAGAAAQGTWAVEKTLHIGGEGGWDYVTVDPDAHRLYVPRSTHTMIIDTESGKTVADIPGQKHNHEVALAPGSGRGFITDGSGSIVIFDLKTNAVLGTIAAHPDADGIIFDPSQRTRAGRIWGRRCLMARKAGLDPRPADGPAN